MDQTPSRNPGASHLEKKEEEECVKLFLTKNLRLQKLWSSKFFQFVIKLIAFGWCFVRKNDARFRRVSDPLWYEGNSGAPDGNHRRSSWKTWVCVKIPEIYGKGGVRVGFDIYTGQRLMYMSKVFKGGELVAFRVGPQGARVRMLSEHRPTIPLPPEFVGRWEIPNDKERPPTFWKDGEDRKITYI